jgi:hypothetical protein
MTGSGRQDQFADRSRRSCSRAKPATQSSLLPRGPAIRQMISDLGLLGHFQHIADLDAYSKSVATFASTSSMIGVGRVSTLRA